MIIDEPKKSDGAIAGQGPDLDEILTPDLREVLGNLALNTENHADLSTALEETGRTLAFLVKRHPEFNGAGGELRAKIAQLQDLHSGVSKEVMRYSHAYEDAVVTAGKLEHE
jgi:hypothetical protein